MALSKTPSEHPGHWSRPEPGRRLCDCGRLRSDTAAPVPSLVRALEADSLLDFQPLKRSTGPVRIATWNLDCKLRPGALDLLLGVDADVLLLTEVPVDLDLPGYAVTSPAATMARGQLYSVVAARHALGPLLAVPAPHPASTAAVVDGTTYVCTVLPWSRAEADDCWRGKTYSERAGFAVDDLEPFLMAQTKLVWGGDWNHTFEGTLSGQTRAGRERLELALERLGLTAARLRSSSSLCCPDRCG